MFLALDLAELAAVDALSTNLNLHLVDASRGLREAPLSKKKWSQNSDRRGRGKDVEVAQIEQGAKGTEQTSLGSQRLFFQNSWRPSPTRVRPWTNP